MNKKDMLNACNLWLESIDASGRVKHRPLLQSSGRTGEQSASVVATVGVVVGTAEIKELSEKMRTAQDAGTSAAIEEFKKHPLLGCTTILDMARVASGYDPNDVGNPENVQKYNNYVKKVLECPFLHLVMNNTETLNREEKSWSSAINDVSGLFTGVSDGDKSKIVDSITNLANAVATHSKSTSQSTTLYVVSAINAGENTIEAYIYSSEIQMTETEHKHSDSKQTSVSIKKTIFTFDVEMWPYYAEKVYTKHYASIDDWLNSNTTEQGPETVALCVGRYKKL